MYDYDRTTVPDLPGVYLFKDSRDEIIYVGKSKSLRNRVSSYFVGNDKSAKTKVLVKNISDLDFIVVDNEVEALLLENKLIKKNKPKYNINLKDDKTFAYIKISDERIPKIYSTRRVTDSGTYFGPYTDGYLRREVERLTADVFRLVNKKTYSSKSIINYQIGKAPAPSENDIDVDEYLKNVERAKDFLHGNIRPVLKRLEEEMLEASSKSRFEVALERKKQMEAIRYILERQKVDLIRDYDQDVMVILNDGKDFALIQVFNISKGVISRKREFRFDYYEDDLFENFIKVYYSKKTIPKEILLNRYAWESESDKEVLEEYLLRFRGSKVSLIVPVRGDKRALVVMAEKNAKLGFGDNDVLVQMKDKIGLPKVPKVIEVFDMSNLGSEFLVGGMTRFVDGQRDVAGSRRFLIKSFAGKQDDFASMKEVVRRRYKEYRDGGLGNRDKGKVSGGKKGGLSMPDLILVDGGKGQLRVTVDALKEIGVKVPVISLAKRDEEIFVLGKKESLKFDRNSSMMLFIRLMRDSVHNYVVAYNRKRRQMKMCDDMMNKDEKNLKE